MAKKDNVRVNLYMNPSIVENLDNHAAKLGLSRSGAASVILYEYFRTESATAAIAEMKNSGMFDAVSKQLGIQNV